METVEESITTYLAEVKASMEALPLDEIKDVAAAIYEAYKSGRQVFIMGNGGSAAAATHFACDLTKGTAFPNRRRLRATSLVDNIALLTAWSNDQAYEDVFVEQLTDMIGAGDVVIAISTSGDSPNILRAIAYANHCGALTIGLAGADGGRLKDIAQHCLIVPTRCVEATEGLHLVILHAIKLWLRGMIGLESGLS
ncbi:MAG: SIS domain-containing protein [Chloroflexi bacterium]|nr:SIS domain-containing protein [Chloroflexota bacterium]